MACRFCAGNKLQDVVNMSTCVERLAANGAEIHRVPAQGDHILSSLLEGPSQAGPPPSCPLHCPDRLCWCPLRVYVPSHVLMR